MTAFSSIVMNYFKYLVDAYGFSVKKVEESNEGMEIEGRIEFETNTTFVTVSSEQLTAGAIVGRVVDDKYRYFLNPVTIHEYLSLTETDKNLLYSLDPKDDKRAKAIIRQTRLSHKNNLGNDPVDIQTQISNYSMWLRQHAEPFLRGDFSRWLEIYEYKVYSTRAAFLRSGKEEFVRTVNSDSNIRVSIFQSNFDYLNKLRQEYGHK